MKEKKDRSVPRFALSMLLLIVLVISTGLALRKTEGREIKNEPKDFVNLLMSENRHVQPLELADMIIQDDPSLTLIDLRDPDSFKKFSLPGAMNIQPDSLVGSVKLLEQLENRQLVLYDNDERLSNTTWILTRQVGLMEVSILRGGLNAWFEEVLKVEDNEPDLTSDKDKQSIRKASSIYFGVHHDLPDYVLKEDKKSFAPKKKSTPKKEVKTKPKKKKKMPEGGC